MASRYSELAGGGSDGKGNVGVMRRYRILRGMCTDLWEPGAALPSFACKAS